MKNKMNFKTASILLLSLFALLYTSTTVSAQASTKEIIYVKIVVDGLSCPFCAYGLEKKLKKIKSSTDVTIGLESGEATFNVPKDQQPTEGALREIVKDAGFTPKEIIFSGIPFKEKDE